MTEFSDRVRLSRFMGITSGQLSGMPPNTGFYPLTNANDDYQILEFFRNHHDDDLVESFMEILYQTWCDGSLGPACYKRGDYFKAAITVLDRQNHD